jgi:HK97 family phage portal protein
MGLFDRLLGRDVPVIRSKSATIGGTALENFLRDGIAMDKQSVAFSVAAVYACVRVIAETCSSLPLVLYKRRADGGKDRAEGDPLYDLLKYRPNPFQTSMEWREQLFTNALLRGNAYCHVIRDSNGFVIELLPLDPDAMTVTRGAYGLVYTYKPSEGKHQVFEKRSPTDSPRIMHIKCLSTDGIIGRSVLQDSAETFSSARSAQRYGQRVLDNDATPSVVIRHPEVLDEEAARRLRDSWQSTFGGSGRAGGTAVLEEGMSLEKVSMTSQDVQYLETRRFLRSEIASIFRVPLHLIGDLERATFSNIEQQSIEFVMHCIRPWAVRFEQALHAAILSDSTQQKRTYFAELMLDGLMRGDQKSRYDAYNVGRNAGFLSVNDIRAFENMNPIEGGDRYLEPLNMQAVNR